MKSKTLAEYLVKYRFFHGLSQTDLAERCKLTTPTICNIEVGKCNVSFITYKKLAEGLNVSVEELTNLKLK